MTARDDYTWLARYIGDDSCLGDDAAKALDEIDRLRAEVDEWRALDEYLRP